MSLAAGCSGRPSTEGGRPRSKPNIILISADTVRADHLGCYGYPHPTSPFIDTLSRRGVRFDHAFAQTSWTLPAHMSMLTGRYPHSHRVDNTGRSLPPTETTLAEHLRRAGYTTTAFVSWVYVSRKYGFDRGFDAFHELLPPPTRELNQRLHSAVRAGKVVDQVIAWVRAAPPTPFFLFVHLFDPHMHYEPLPEYARMFDRNYRDARKGTYRHLRRYIAGLSHDAERIDPAKLRQITALYDGEIRYTDEQLRRLFSALEAEALLDDALVVFTSDHGEEFDDHGSMEGHGWTLFDEVLRVPLIMRFPRFRHAGTRVKALAQSVDIGPTVLAYAGIEVPATMEGRNLLPLLESEADDAHYVFSQLNHFNRRWAVRSARYKLIYTAKGNAFGVPVTPGYELYDLTQDAHEQHNIYDPSLPVAAHLQSVLETWMRKRQPLQPVPRPDLSTEELQRLRDLGYVE